MSAVHPVFAPLIDGLSGHLAERPKYPLTFETCPHDQEHFGDTQVADTHDYHHEVYAECLDCGATIPGWKERATGDTTWRLDEAERGT